MTSDLQEDGIKLSNALSCQSDQRCFMTKKSLHIKIYYFYFHILEMGAKNRFCIAFVILTCYFEQHFSVRKYNSSELIYTSMSFIVENAHDFLTN